MYCFTPIHQSLLLSISPKQQLALPDFRKLYRHVEEDLAPGTYRLNIDYNYPVDNFNGKKKLIFSTVSWQGQSHCQFRLLTNEYKIWLGLIF